LVIYKYLKKKHFIDFKDRGIVLLNTLHSLRKEEGAIRDEFEGLQRLRVDAKRKPSSFSSEEAHSLFPNIRFSKKITKNAITVMPNAHVISDTEVADAFVFCTSLKLDSRLSNKWDYDSHYKIIDPIKFAEIIFWKLNEEICLSCFKIGKVKYKKKEIEITNENDRKVLSDDNSKKFWDICFTKPMKFIDEKEFRFVFVPQFAKEIKPRLLTCLELRGCCEF